MAGNGTFVAFELPEDHRMIREAIRDIAVNEIVPHAARVDENSAFPQAAYDALRASDFHAPHIGVEYGVGADALATCILIEEVVRACASISLIPAVNELGTMPLILAASEEVNAKYLPPIARGDALFAYGLPEREAGSDTASMVCRATPDGDDWVLSGQKSWITNAGAAKYYTVFAVTDPSAKRGSPVSAFVVERSDPGFAFGAPERKKGIKGSPAASCASTMFDCPVTVPSARQARESRSRFAPSTTRGSRSVHRPLESRRPPSMLRSPT